MSNFLKAKKYFATRKSVSVIFDGDTSRESRLTDKQHYVLFDVDMHPIDVVDVTHVADANAVRLTPPPGSLSGTHVLLGIKFLDGHEDHFERVAIDSSASQVPAQRVNVVEGLPAVDRTARAVEDAVSYSVLTESVDSSMRAAPVAPGASGGSISQLVSQTLRDVLGWKVRDGDPRGFEGALTASFAPKPRDIDGGTDWTWTPRTYAVQTDLYGGISGAQASLYKRAQEALAQALPLLDGLTPLNPEADLEDIAAFKAVIRTQLNELVTELASPGGPAMTRVERYFDVLLANPGESYEAAGRLATAEPDDLGGTLGQLREQLGFDRSSGLVNSVEDEQNQTNYRILADYVTSLAQSWLNSRSFFGIGAKQPFLGTQLVPISRQLSVIAETVAEVRFTLDSVFIGAAERQTIQLPFPEDVAQPMYTEDFLNWILNFVGNEAPSYVKDGGKLGITNSLLPFASQLAEMARALQDLTKGKDLPHGFRTARVRRSVEALGDELERLVDLVTPLNRTAAVEPPHGVLNVLAEDRGLVIRPSPVALAAGKTAVVTLINVTSQALTVRGDVGSSQAFGFGNDPLKPKASIENLDIAAGDSLDVMLVGSAPAAPAGGKALAKSRGTATFAFRSPRGEPVREVELQVDLV